MQDIPNQAQPTDRIGLQVQDARNGATPSVVNFCMFCGCFSADEE